MVSLMGRILVMKKSEKVIQRVWLSASVLVKSLTVRRVKEFLCDSPLLFRVGAVTEPSVEVHTP